MQDQLEAHHQIVDFEHRLVQTSVNDGSTLGQVRLVAVCDFADPHMRSSRRQQPAVLENCQDLQKQAHATKRLALIAILLLKSCKVAVMQRVVMDSNGCGTCADHAAHLAKKLMMRKRQCSSAAIRTMFTGGSNISVMRGITKPLLKHPLLPVGIKYSNPL